MTDLTGEDLRALAARARSMKDQYADIGRDLGRLECTGYGGRGLVAATINGESRLTALRIDPSVIDPDDPESLAELVIEACNEATQLIAARRSEQLRQITGGLQDMASALRAAPLAVGGTVTPRFPSRESRPRSD